MCTFGNKFILDDRYQVCSCGKHLWSIRRNKVITITEKTRVVDNQKNYHKATTYIHDISGFEKQIPNTGQHLWFSSRVFFVMILVFAFVVFHFSFFCQEKYNRFDSNKLFKYVIGMSGLKKDF